MQAQLDYFTLKGKSQGLSKYDAEMILKFEQALNEKRINKTEELVSAPKTKVLAYKPNKNSNNVINVTA